MSNDKKAVMQSVIVAYAHRVGELLHGAGNLPQEDLEYVALAMSRLKDERLKSCVAELLRWDDEERAEIETLFAIAIEAMKACTPEDLSKAARTVELRFHIKLEDKDDWSRMVGL